MDGNGDNVEWDMAAVLFATVAGMDLAQKPLILALTPRQHTP